MGNSSAALECGGRPACRAAAQAGRVGKLADALPDNRLGRHVAGQLVRCGTSPGPNYEEACAGESRSDFIHKLSIALKELRESFFWLRLITRANMIERDRMAPMIDERDQLWRIVAQAIITAKANREKERTTRRQ